MDWWKGFWRPALLLIGGMAGVFHETVMARGPRLELLGVFCGMMGLAPFLPLDEFLQRRRNGKDEPKEGPK